MGCLLSGRSLGFLEGGGGEAVPCASFWISWRKGRNVSSRVCSRRKYPMRSYDSDLSFQDFLVIMGKRHMDLKSLLFH